MMKVDLVGPRRRGLALGLNEAAGYSAVAVTALVTGVHRRPGRPPTRAVLARARRGDRRPRALGVGHSRDAGSREPRARARRAAGRPPWRTVVLRTSFIDPSLSAASQAGLVNNLNDGMAWGLLPLFYAAAGLPLTEIADAGRRIPADVGNLSARDGRAVRPHRAEGADRRRAGPPGRGDRGNRRDDGLLAVVRGVRRPRTRDGDGLPDASRRGRRRRGSRVARIGARRVPDVAGPRVCRRGDPRRRRRGPGGHVDGDRRRGCDHASRPGSSSPSGCTRRVHIAEPAGPNATMPR